ncbi:hypothetical protein ACU4GD_20900 [Cupriavidus basilensis]
MGESGSGKSTVGRVYRRPGAIPTAAAS